MNEQGYWDLFRRRYARRRLLRGGGVGLAGLALAACTSTTASPTAAPAAAPTTGAAGATAGPAATPTGAARQPKMGGTFKQTQGSADQPHLDPHLVSSNALSIIGPGPAWSQLLAYKHGPGIGENYEIVGDLAESWQQADDTTYVFKIRSGVKFHNIPPVNGRELVAEDIAYSFQRIIDGRANASYMAGVAKMEAPPTARSSPARRSTSGATCARAR
jgi:peptide/nickel transport system substrate-binding protein